MKCVTIIHCTTASHTSCLLVVSLYSPFFIRYNCIIQPPLHCLLCSASSHKQHCSPRSLQTSEQTLSIHFYGMPLTACESKASPKKTNQQNVYICLFSGYFCDELCAVVGEPSTPALSHLILMHECNIQFFV